MTIIYINNWQYGRVLSKTRHSMAAEHFVIFYQFEPYFYSVQLLPIHSNTNLVHYVCLYL